MASDKIIKSNEEWQNELTPEQYQILREKATERPGSGEYDQFFEPGRYLCAACGQELFGSQSKYDAGCGWPSFTEASDKNNVETAPDFSHGMSRTEVRCSRCGGHLGHVFDD
jgi:peptide-methionine (R)-S-oxide reductase